MTSSKLLLYFFYEKSISTILSFPWKVNNIGETKKNEKDPPRSRKCLNSCHTKDKWIYSYICMWGFFRIVFHPFFYSRNLFTHKIKVFRKGCVENNWKFQLPEDSIAVACHTSKYVATDKRFFLTLLTLNDVRRYPHPD